MEEETVHHLDLPFNEHEYNDTVEMFELPKEE